MKKENIRKAMEIAVKEATRSIKDDLNGPFGAAIIDKQGNIIAVAANGSLEENDPTSHAEINAIRIACKKLATQDLSNYIMITTVFPCPMCLGAIMWANIKKLRYGASLKDAKQAGFRNDLMYQYIQDGMKNQETLHIEQSEKESCLMLFDMYHKKNIL